MIPVTKPFLPPREDYEVFLKQIWERNWLTNNGPLVNELELRLKEYLGLAHLLYVCNGTVALQLATKALHLKGEIITTPFSYVATTSAIVWEGCTPVFCDIDPHSLNLDPKQIEQHITSKTVAILATHTYGNCCDIDAIDRIAEKHNLKVIYDASHSFGAKFRNKSVYQFGHISTASFHATKLFHTIEGGALITKDAELLRRLSFMRNFGHDGPEQFEDIGINGKNSEFHAAMGLLNLRFIDKIIANRKTIHQTYHWWLQHIRARTITYHPDCEPNYSYFPLIFESESALLKAKAQLEAYSVFPRRYFHPALNTLKYVQNPVMPVSDELSRRVLCLPVYDNISKEEIDYICRLILRAQNN